MFSSILSIAKASVKLFVSCNKLPSKYSYFRIQFCVMMQNLFTFLMLLLLIFTHCTRKNLFSAGVASESSGADSCWMDRFSLLTWTLRANFLHLGLGDTWEVGSKSRLKVIPKKEYHLCITLVTVTKIWKQPKCSSTDEWIKKNDKEDVIYI